MSSPNLIVPVPGARSRREFLTLGTSGAFLIACGKALPIQTPDGGLFDAGPLDAGPGDMDGGPDAGPACADPFAGGTLVRTVDFNEPQATLNTPMGQGLDGRLYTDLSTLDPSDPITPTDHFYIRTRASSLLPPTSPWSINIHGLVSSPLTLNIDDLMPMVAPAGNHLMECSGNGSFAHFGMLSTAEWSGIPVSDVLSMVNITPQATRVLFSGFDQYPVASGNSTPGCSWVFTFQQLQDAGAFLATEINGAPLPIDHGFPIRLMVPNWYGCCCAKWLNEIILVDDTEPATSQMQEFASRTMQNGTPALAKDYLPGTMDQAAMPIRVEEWTVNGSTLYKVVGIMWGGYQVTSNLAIRFNPTEAWVPVDVCPPQSNNMTWTIWSHAWRPTTPGVPYAIDLMVQDPNNPGFADPSIPQRRALRNPPFYRRSVTIQDV